MTLPDAFISQTIVSGVLASARRTPGKIALTEGERALTFGELADRIAQVRRAATAQGLQPGDHVALLSPNCLEYVELVLGLSSIGISVVLVNPRLTAPEIAYILEDSASRMLIAHASTSSLLEPQVTRLVETTILIGDDLAHWIATGEKTEARGSAQEWETFALSYTAGTTGKPKGVMLSHRSRVLTFLGMGVEYGCYSPEDRTLALAPMYHGAGFAFALAPIFFGGRCDIMARFDPEEVLHRLAHDHLNSTFMVPTHFNAIFGLGAKALAGLKFPKLKTIISNAAPLPQATKEKIVELFGSTILHETYGSTEAGIVSNIRPADQLRKTRCVGQAFPMTMISLRDEQGREVGPGEVGELFSHSPYLFNGYWRQPEASREAFRDGWVSVGDLAVRDEEGFIYIVDRKKDVIISGGVNIYPREIEEVLVRHPAVAEAAVAGVADDYWGESPKAWLVMREGMQAQAADLEAFCRESLAGYKVPKVFETIAALPRNAAGKVLKRELRSELRDHAATHQEKTS